MDAIISKLESIAEKVDRICYAFYRYEIKNGLVLLDTIVSDIELILTQHAEQPEVIQEINQLLQMVLLAVEKNDYLIAADLLKYEFLHRITLLG